MSAPNPDNSRCAPKFFRRLALLFSMTAAALGAQPVQAAQYDIKTMTPDIQRALDGRQQRYEALQSMKAKGWLGENNQGYVTPLDNAAASAPLAQQENADRAVIYGAIVDQNGLGAAGLGKVQIAFAEVQRERARPGDSIQLPNGEWVKK